MKCSKEYVRICALLDATAGYPSFRGQLRMSIRNPSFVAMVTLLFCENRSLCNIGNPSFTAPLLSPRGFMRLVVSTAALPV